jgi:murein DD-endopeptidase MepM/ murein hydrolase activator NlpD
MTESPDVTRQHLFESMEMITGVPWTYLAAMDQYEQNIRRLKKDSSSDNRVISIKIPEPLWVGFANPNLDDEHLASILFFQGIGRDGNGDQLAKQTDDIDVLYSIALYLGQNGTDEDSIREQLWRYYKHSVPVDIITHTAKVFKKFGRIDLKGSAFPIPLTYNYTYRSTWGDRRGWGGLRIHEGTDIFADYGTPVLSTCYGYVELKGWNRYGGWRIGIRDLQNNYHYFAHLSGFRKGLKIGDIVQPGELIGSVGSTGYGPPGTSGKFPPHLHYGLYKFNGQNTYSFDPYPLLKKWELQAKERRKSREESKANAPIKQ